MDKLVEIKLCPLRSLTLAANCNMESTRTIFSECYEEKCALWNEEGKCCSLKAGLFDSHKN